MKLQVSQDSAPSTVWAAVLITCIAVMSGVCLLILFDIYRDSLREDAARTVFEQGEHITRELSRHPFLADSAAGRAERDGFQRLIRAVAEVEPAIEYVSVTRGEEIEFREQVRPLDPAQSPETSSVVPVAMQPQMIDTGQEQIPVMSFTAVVPVPGDSSRLLEVALRREAVLREEAGASRALGSMFKVAMATVIVAFAACTVLAIWLMRREMVRQERRRTEEHLAFAGALADGVIHDIRNPMNSLRLDAQMLAKEAAKGDSCGLPRVSELASRLQATVDRTDGMLNEYLYLATPDKGENENVDLVECIRDSHALLAPRLEQARVSMEMDLDVNRLVVTGRPVQLKRGLVNILINAIQASEDGQVIRVSARRENGMARVDIRDAGVGIPPSDRRRIFEMFYSTRPGGTGLGLWIAKMAVERHNGNLWVTDGDEGGARFTIQIPLTQGDAA